MATSNPLLTDSLACLRECIISDGAIIPTTSEDATTASDVNTSLAVATHLLLTKPVRQTFPLDGPTRFMSSGQPINLRSVYFAYLMRDNAIPDYVAAAQKLNEELSAPEGAGGTVHQLVFLERVSLLSWLDIGSGESEHIKPLASEASAAQAAGLAQVASGATGGIATVPSGAAGARLGKPIDPRLAEIYQLERPMSDRNILLRGAKPTDFSHVRKIAELFLGRNRNKVAPQPTTAPVSTPPTMGSLSKKPGRRPDPIILLSPSASSLLRMSNIKSFLDGGLYIPPDSALAGSSANILHISRQLNSIDPSRPLRFILVDTPEQFKPDYWQRVVAVFTTGQTWQFKSYKWPQAPELFRHVLGIYVGWKGDDVPPTVRGWGRGVLNASVDKWNSANGPQNRWRDREIVEEIWSNIEEAMRSRGWGVEGKGG